MMDERNIKTSISLFKRRVCRFSDNLKMHVLAECLEKRYLERKRINICTIEHINQYLDSINLSGKGEMPYEQVARDEDINLSSELNFRRSFESENELRDVSDPEKIIHIVGSPRSGTTLLFNMLAYVGNFAYFNSISHFKWSLYNHRHCKQKFLHEVDSPVLLFDTKRMRVEGNLILPSESEDIFNRSIRVYRHIRGHEYFIRNPLEIDIDNLKKNIRKHLYLFNRKFFLTKSPFNSFRIKKLNSLYENTFYIHIHRNGYSTAKSISENRFKYYCKNQCEDDPVAFWKMHIDSVLSDVPVEKTLHISLEALIRNPQKWLEKIFKWLSLRMNKKLNDNLKFRPVTEEKNGKMHPVIEEINYKLGYI